MVRNLGEEERRKLDDALLSRPGEGDAEAPWWWGGEDDAAATAEAFGRTLNRGR